jgi:phage regulator Rha-like protein
MLNLINVLISNIDLRIVSVSNVDDPLTQSLISYKQKLNILKTIVHSLSDLVSYGFHTNLQKQVQNRDLSTIIQIILNDKIKHLQHLNNLLIKDFPETEQKMEKIRQTMAEHRRLKKLENDLILFQQETDSLQHNFESNLEQDKMMHNFNKLKRITWSYVNIVTHTIDFGAFSLRNVTRHCINLVTSIPIGFAEGIGYNLNDIVWSILNNLWLTIFSIITFYCLVKKFINKFI